MSAFSFINSKRPSEGKSRNELNGGMSASILDDIYDQNLHHSHDQSTTPQDTHKSRQLFTSLFDFSDNISGASHASLSEISLSATSPSVPKHVNSEPKKSAFSFIGSSSRPKTSSPNPTESTKPNKRNHSTSPAFLVHPGPSNVVSLNGYNQSLPLLNTINSDSRKLSEQAAWKQVQTEKKREISLIQRLYERYELVNQQINQETANNLKAEKEQALEAENYLAAEALQLKQEEQTKQITELFTDTMSNLDNQIQQSWESLANILAKESRIAENLAEASQKAKEDRAQKLDKADFNYKCHHEMKLQQINAQRAEIGQEKSEIAFDLDMWIQSDAELNEKMYELVHEDLDEKEELESKENALQTQIDELLRSVKKLEKERDMHRSRINELDTAIEQVLSKHEPEKDAHLNEHTLIETRKEQMDIRCTNLDQEDTELHHQLKRHTEEIAEEWALLGEEEKRIREISIQADNSKFEADKMTQTCLKVVKACNKSVMEKKKEVSQVCEKLTDHRKKLEHAQKNRFAARQKLDELEETVEHTEYQIKSLNRQKTLAVESRQFQSAAITAERIKSSQNLLEGLSKKRDSQEEESKRCQLAILECENEMDRLEKEYKTLVNLAGTSIVEQLENAKSSLQETESLLYSNHSELHDIINHEVEKITKHIQSVNVYLQILSNEFKDPPANKTSLL